MVLGRAQQCTNIVDEYAALAAGIPFAICPDAARILRASGPVA